MRRRGFTLIELAIALAIAAVLFAAVAISLGAITGTKAKASAGELGGVIRSLYDTAALSGKTCRLVFQLPGPKEDDEPTRYWAECASGSLTTSKNRDDELKDANMERGRDEKGPKREDRRFESYEKNRDPNLQELLAVEKDRVDGVAKFQQYTSPEIESRELPSSVNVSVWTKHQREAVKSGTAYLYFFPQGFTEKAYIYVRQGSNVWTITVAPLTGKTSVVSEELEVPSA
jgi:general secretion pathway protein H